MEKQLIIDKLNELKQLAESAGNEELATIMNAIAGAVVVGKYAEQILANAIAKCIVEELMPVVMRNQQEEQN